MWIVTIKKDYVELNFNFSVLEEATYFIGLAAGNCKDNCEIGFKFDKEEVK